MTEEVKGEFRHSFAIKQVSDEVVFDGEPGIFIEGYCAVWEPRDRQGENWNLDFSPSSPSRKALEAYFAQNPVVLFNHGLDKNVGRKAIGRAVDWRVDDHGLWVKDFIQRPEPGTELMNVYRSIKSGIYRTFSIAMDYMATKFNTIRHLLDVKEHSVVSVPAQSRAGFTLSRAMKMAIEKAAKPVEGEARNNLPDEKFVFPDERTFPIPSPDYVRRAVSSWGRYKGKHSFDDFKAKLTALAKELGPQYEAQLPAEWKTGMKFEEAMHLAHSIKAGRAISSANEQQLRQAIATIQSVLGQGVTIEIEQEDDDDQGSGNGCCGDPYCCAEGCCGGQGECGPECCGDLSVMSGAPGDMPAKKPGKMPMQTGAKSISEASNALSILKGALTKMSDKVLEGAPANEGGVVTLTKEQAEQFSQILAERESLRLEREAQKMADLKIAEEQKAAEEQAKREAEEKAKLEQMVEEKLAVMRTGKKMLYTPTTSYKEKGVNINKTEEFSFAKFALYGTRGQEWNYVENYMEKTGQKAYYQETIGNQGGFTVPTEQSNEIVELLRSQAVVRNMGVRVTPMQSDVLTKSRRVGSATAYWGAEAATMTDGTPSAPYGQVRFTAKKLYCVVAVTKEQLADAASAEADIRQDLAYQMALAEDLAFLNGSGQNETPLGILNTVGINTFAYATGAASAAPEYKALVKAAGVVRTNNAKPNGVIMHSRHNDYIQSVTDTTGQPIFRNAIGGYNWNNVNATLLSRNSSDPNAVELGEILGMRQALSNQLTITATTSGTGPVIVGDFRFAEIGERQGVEIEIDNSQGFFRDVVYIKATRRVDFVLTIPAAFCVITAYPGIDIA